MKKLSTTLLAVSLALGLTGILHATIISVSSSAPTPGTDDISQLSSAGYTGANDNPPGAGNYYTNGYPDGAGETFTTGSNAGGYDVNSLSLQIGDTGSSNTTFTFNIFAVTGATTYNTTPIYSETFAHASFSDNDWITATLTAPPLLAADTTYAFSLNLGSQNYLQLAWTASAGPDGSSLAGFNSGTLVLPTSASSNAFDVGLTAVTTPEPSTWALMLGGLGVLAFVVRRRAAKA
jgi:PEP-CTERM motif